MRRLLFRRFAPMSMSLAGLVFAATAIAEPVAGRDLAASCAGCHPAALRPGGLPPLNGRPEAELVAAMADFRRGARPPLLMQQIARGYTDEQIRQLARWFAAQPAAR